MDSTGNKYCRDHLYRSQLDEISALLLPRGLLALAVREARLKNSLGNHGASASVEHCLRVTKYAWQNQSRAHNDDERALLRGTRLRAVYQPGFPVRFQDRLLGPAREHQLDKRVSERRLHH